MKPLLFAALALALASIGCGHDPNCRPLEGAEVDSICLPSSGAPDQSLTIMARQECGGCGGARMDSCVVEVTGQQIHLSFSGEFCDPDPDLACAAICRITELPCTIPPLAAGSYNVIGLRAESISPRALEIAPGGSSRCQYSNP